MANTKMGPMQRRLLAWMQEDASDLAPQPAYMLKSLVRFTDMAYRQVESAMRHLHQRGLVEEIGTNRTRKIWRLTEAGRRYSE